MKATPGSILIFQNQLDLNYLGNVVNEKDKECTFESGLNNFSTLCSGKKYDLIIIAATGDVPILNEVIDIVSGSMNFHTPLLVICDDNTDVIGEVVSRQYDFIIFPFSNEEFKWRIDQIIRRSKTEEIVHHNIVRLRSVFDNLPVAIVQTDSTGRILFVSREFGTILETGENNVLKENFFQLCHPDDYFIERKQLDRLLKRESERVRYEIRLINNEGRTKVCRILATSLWKDKDVFTSYIFVIETVN